VTPTPQRPCRKRVAESSPEPLAHSLARESEKSPSTASEPTPSTSPAAAPLDADLGRLIERWPALSATAKRMILAAVEADTVAERCPARGTVSNLPGTSWPQARTNAPATEAVSPAPSPASAQQASARTAQIDLFGMRNG
jgi:hypothetical protein